MEGAAAVALAAFLKNPAPYTGKTSAILLWGSKISEWVRKLL
jgi:hypothetical protein